MKAGRIIPGIAVVIATAVLSVALPVALGQSRAHAEGNVQGYASSTPLENGTIVELVSGKTDQVQMATQANLQNMFGVTVDRSQLLISSSNDSLPNEAYVAVSGTYNTLVSTQNGPISSGDFVTMSAINGVAMKADTTQKTVFGRATAGFDGSGVTLGTTTLKDSAGVTKTVKLGMIPVTIDIQRNPNVKSTTVNLPKALQRIGQAIAEKQVSPIRIYLSVAITGISIIAAAVILYAGVRNSVISIGRNPMSKKSIFRALIEVILASLLIIIVGLFAVYLLLKL